MASINNNSVNIVEKNIAFKIAQQFPAYYREEGKELVDMVEHYYKFVESDPNMGVYNARKLFEYRDIGTTLSSMVIFWKNKYMADLPAMDDATIRFVIKNILDLYRRKGTESGIKLFFRMFYQEDADIKYPSKYMLKPSSSIWKTGVYLQVYPNNNEFYNNTRTLHYEYKDLISRNIYGSISKAKAIVDKINFVYLNNTLTPIIYITDPKGKFTKYDDIISRINGEDIAFGKLNGSADGLEIDGTYGGTTGNKVGDILNIVSIDGNGKGGLAIVTDLEDEFTGTINYSVLDGGFGYTIENTKIFVSTQALVLNNPNFQFVEFERLRDTANNEGVVIGQNSVAVGIMMTNGQFDLARDINTLDRFEYAANGAIIADNNITLTAYDSFTGTGDIFTVSGYNGSSPGPLYANTGDPTHAKVGELSDVQTVSLITDVIGNFLNVPLNSANFNTVPPALIPMSGTANPVNLSTPMPDAFDLTPFNIGVIENFENINPGADYKNDVWTLVKDEVMLAFERFNQVLLIGNFSATFSVGDRISQAATDTNGIIIDIDNDAGLLYVRPYAYYGFSSNSDITHKGNDYAVTAIQTNYLSRKFGDNAKINSKTLFSTGRISAAEIRNSGFGYADGETVLLTNDAGVPQAQAILSAKSQGITSGFWGGQSSHLNGYLKTLAEDGEDVYYDSKMKIQDSDYYQEYSYEIQSTIDQSRYKTELLNNVHLAGSKVFSSFVYKNKVGTGITSKFMVVKKDDYIVGGYEIVGPDQYVGDYTVRADNFIFTVDTINIKVDNA
jgi:hypothetical protein